MHTYLHTKVHKPRKKPSDLLLFTHKTSYLPILVSLLDTAFDESGSSVIQNIDRELPDPTHKNLLTAVKFWTFKTVDYKK